MTPESLAESLVILEMEPVETTDAANVTLDWVSVSKTSVMPEKLGFSPAPKIRETVARRFPPESSCGSSTRVAVPVNAPEKSERVPELDT